ncbi:DUF2087 domain-containing protein [Allostreptomyces psammosilenae]|uniref:DUF2087 domain-containing protein n=1 Tax=Allostreptomyces psammosilenae TaxID=1892865 RepID=A0A853A5V3_9ACTN|nr:DUF2087 domain-containing protein [Allostreptomyces psammosilenae]NYI08224.1 hypothetical protein [Allostreptomyces psammosilenae]
MALETPAATPMPRPDDGHALGPASGRQAEAVLRAFVRDGRLVRLPARFGRRRLVLRHVAERAFAFGDEYDERQVNDILRGWCDGGETDHVTLRRHLVDDGLLAREHGRYWRPSGEETAAATAPAPAAAPGG